MTELCNANGLSNKLLACLVTVLTSYFITEKARGSRSVKLIYGPSCCSNVHMKSWRYDTVINTTEPQLNEVLHIIHFIQKFLWKMQRKNTVTTTRLKDKSRNIFGYFTSLYAFRNSNPTAKFTGKTKHSKRQQGRDGSFKILSIGIYRYIYNLLLIWITTWVCHAQQACVGEGLNRC